MLTNKLSATSLALLACFMVYQNAHSQAVDPVELFQKLDTNSDGVVTADEVPDDKKASFDRLLRIGDTNQDKELTQKEVSDALGNNKTMRQKQDKEKSSRGQRDGERQKAGSRSSQRGPGQTGQARGQQGGRSRGGGSGSVSPTELLSRFDENNDGKLTADEIPEQATRLVQMMQDADKNQDKSVTKKELEDYFSTLGGQGSGQRQGARQGSGESRQGQQPGGRRPGRMQSGQGGQGSGFGQRGGGFGQGGQGRGGGGMSITPDAILSRFDSNKDGKLSPDEVPGQAGRLAQMMKDADKNEDGTVTKQELTQYLSSSGGGQPMRGGRPSARGGGNPRGGGAFGANLPKVGQPLPDLVAYTSDGETVNLSDMKGNYSVLVFGCLT